MAASLPESTRDALLSKPMLAVLTTLGLVGVVYLVPGADRLHLLSPKPFEERSAPAASDSAAAPIGEVQLVDETRDRPELAVPDEAVVPEETPGLPPLPPAIKTKAPPLPIVDPSGKALDPFFDALVAVERKQEGAVARIVHYGDSLLAVDFVTGTLRRKLQKRFGDAGHGYMPIANPWPGYFHNDVFRRASSEWMVSRIVGPFAADGFYGLGGVSFKGFNKAAWAQYGTTDEGEFGRAVSRFGVQYLEQPKGGTIEVEIDDDRVVAIDTSGQSPALREHVIEVPDGPHRFDLRVAEGPVRAFGTWMERDVPGVILDSVGIQGARLRFLDQSDDAHFAQALQMRNPHLIVFEFGLNESADGFAYPMDRYRETSLAVMKQIREALPDTACFVVAPNDVARKRGSAVVSRRVMPHLVKVQREVAAEVGCAFFNTYEAMGGAGSMPTWVQRGLGQPDLTHPTTVGADVIGAWIYRAVMDSYEPYRQRQGGAPAVPASASAVPASASGVPASASGAPAR